MSEFSHLDVNHGFISPLDALEVINRINETVIADSVRQIAAEQPVTDERNIGSAFASLIRDPELESNTILRGNGKDTETQLQHGSIGISRLTSVIDDVIRDHEAFEPYNVAKLTNANRDELEPESVDDDLLSLLADDWTRWREKWKTS